jgi:membrane protein YdbS with pleckstrin-like domain
MGVTFESKRDGWIVALIWAGAVASAGGGLAQYNTPAPLWIRVGMLAFLVAAAAFMLWILYDTSYTIDHEQLLIRSGPLRYRVPLRDIHSVDPSRNPLSSPACSLDRLLIRWGGRRKRILISPQRKPDFLRELNQRCPQLEFAGEALRRREVTQ